MKYLKSAARLLDRKDFNKGDLDLSKEVLWASVGQRAAKLQAGKGGCLKKHSAMRPGSRLAGPRGRIFFQASNFDSF